MNERLFDVEIETRTCNMCKHFYRKRWYRNNKSWGKCALGRSTYDAKANRAICIVFEPKEAEW